MSSATLEGWTPMLVHWEQWWDGDDHAPTEVIRCCKRCFPKGAAAPTATAIEGLVPLIPMLVSPSGIVHQAERGDKTDCGRDCTGPDWWHRS
jgi:hypothetical protein